MNQNITIKRPDWQYKRGQKIAFKIILQFYYGSLYPQANPEVSGKNAGRFTNVGPEEVLAIINEEIKLAKTKQKNENIWVNGKS